MRISLKRHWYIPAIIFGFALLNIMQRLGSPVIVVSVHGNDADDGIRKPVRTIQHAVDIAPAGAVIRIGRGLYRESVTIPDIPGKISPIKLLAVGTNNSDVIITGSEPSSSLPWQRCDARSCPSLPEKSVPHAYRTFIPWEEAPTLLIQYLPDGSRIKLPVARGPNTLPKNPDKFHEFWWQAGGGDAKNGIISDPKTLRSLPDITGGRIFLMDGDQRCGAYEYIQEITGHNRRTGTLTTNGPIGANTYGIHEEGVGNFTKYMVEDAVGLLDEPGEWYFDRDSRMLYLWPRSDGNPAESRIEIGRRKTAFVIDRSHVTIAGLSIQNTNDHNEIGYPSGGIAIAPKRKLTDIRLLNNTVEYAGYGIWADAENGSIEYLRLSGNVLRNISKSAMTFSGSPTSPTSLSHITIERSDITQSGFPYAEPALLVMRTSHVLIRNNRISRTGGYGIHLTGFEKQGYISDDLHVTGNTISHTCQNASSCAGLKIFGGTFSRTDLTGNHIQDIRGWSLCQEKQFGKAGDAMGIFVSNASGVTVRQNDIADIFGTAILVFTRQFPTTDNAIVGNILKYSETGIAMTGNEGGPDTDPRANATRHDRSLIENNILQHMRTALLLDPAKTDSIRISGNSYWDNASALFFENTRFTDAADIPHANPLWEHDSLLGKIKNIRFR